jgi:SAM-dependent methyltransferase
VKGKEGNHNAASQRSHDDWHAAKLAPVRGLPAGSHLRTGDLAVEVLRSASELSEARQRTADRRALEHLLCETLADREIWTLPGFCKACERAVAFQGDWLSSDGKTINFRERLICLYCKLNSRMRFMAQLLSATLRAAPPQAPTYLFEQMTPFFYWATEALPGTVIGSEYLGPEKASGTTMEGVRHEDALALSFDDASLGTIVSNDVFEHVPDIDLSLAECSRVLRPGGRLYFSIPFQGSAQTVQRAALRDGQIVNLLPPEYHDNPLDPQGSLVFYDHGWDILERCRRAGFADAYLLGYWSLLYGYLGHGLQLVFVAERSSARRPHRRGQVLPATPGSKKRS